LLGGTSEHDASELMDDVETARNNRHASAWMRKAAEPGYRPAQWQLGTFYEQKRGMPADPAGRESTE
jgi:TPR repeat protein